MQRRRGFTLIELVVVVIILAVLAAVAVPKFINMGTSARIASLKAMDGVLRSTAENLRVLCKTNATCDYTSYQQRITLGDKDAVFALGWPEAGDCLDCSQIDSWVTYAGFTASLIPNNRTRFALDGAPNPATCAVTFVDAFAYFDGKLHIETDITGC